MDGVKMVSGTIPQAKMGAESVFFGGDLMLVEMGLIGEVPSHTGRNDHLRICFLPACYACGMNCFLFAFLIKNEAV